ncbi:MAG: hypothetical protein PF570_02155 [Candidatus Cloacimonetes bacterium]|jgi:predicted transcriptional regulator of viral defense system|nr:hypothetical protein [Candidatus Cloacimonadota bacterium]
MEKLIEFFKVHHGYSRMKDMRNADIHPRDITKAMDMNIIEKINPGLYKLIDYSWDEHLSFLDVAIAKKNAVICLISALEYHGLSTINPSVISIAVPHNTDKFSMKYPPVKVYYFQNTFYDLGIEKKITKTGTFKIYNAEKTICDMFRYRNKLGEDLALEGLKNYLRRKGADIAKLREYAIKCQVKTVMLPYLKAMVVK